MPAHDVGAGWLKQIQKTSLPLPQSFPPSYPPSSKTTRVLGGGASASAYGGFNGIGDGGAAIVHVGLLFRFDHDAGERFGSGVTDDDAAGGTEFFLCFADGVCDERQRCQVGF